MNPTYEQLNLRLQQHFGIDAACADQKSATQQYRNHLSTLHAFLASVGKTLDGRVGTELGSGFDAAVRAYTAQLSVSPRTRRDRRSHLRLILRVYQEAMQTSRPASSPTSLSLALRAEISKTGMAPKALSRQVGVSPSALQRWLRGALPNRRGIPTLRRLEARLGLQRDHLVAMLPKEGGGTDDVAVPPIEYRERARHLRQTALTISVSELSARYLEEWWSLYEYKTCAMPSLERHPRGVWRCIPVAHHRPAGEFSVRGGMVSPTADIAFERLRSFFGVLSRLPHRDGGLPTECERTQTLAWCAHPLALSAYLDYLTRRSAGLRHNGHRTFCTFVAALLRPKTGFLWQQPDYRLRLPVALQPVDAEGWQRMCERSERLLTDYKRTSTDLSRDPKAPIANLLAQEQPLKPLLDAIERIEQAAAAAPPGGLTEARLRRDALLISMLLSNPLRVRAFITMTWKSDGTGVLRGSSTAGWRIHLQPTHLKNGASKGGKDYSVRLAKWIQPRLEAYLEEYRGTLLQGRESPYLFVSSGGPGMWGGMQRHLAKMSARYIPGSPGFGPHAYRHLVATNWLQQHPNDYLTVAELLNDKLETVLANYAHLKRDMSFSRYEEHVQDLLKTPGSGR
ncbi:putative Site-specific recombinase XerD [Thiomonas arsenitoxydans]|nr:putative Site-specific recombinase XerD [Thiomonas arsenitoxydans]